MEEAFGRSLKEDRKSINLNSACFSKQKYDEIISKVICSKMTLTRKQSANYKILRKYDVFEVNGTTKLIVPSKSFDDEIIYYVHDDELFQILMETHISLGHVGRDKMMRELKKKYKNITYKDINLFLNLCKQCSKKHKRKRKEATDKPTLNELNSKCQVDLIDFQSHPDGEFKFVMVYQEHLTKFRILKALKSTDIKEVADHLINIFTIIGPPLMLQSSNGSEFLGSVIHHLGILWPELQIIHLKSEVDIEYANKEVEHMIIGWMRENFTSKWSSGLRFVQLQKNTKFLSEINKSPYQALFGRAPKHTLAVNKSPYETLFRATEKHQESEEQTVENTIKIELIEKTEPEDNSGDGSIKEEQHYTLIKEENVDILSHICDNCCNDMGTEEICKICEGKISRSSQM